MSFQSHLIFTANDCREVIQCYRMCIALHKRYASVVDAMDIIEKEIELVGDKGTVTVRALFEIGATISLVRQACAQRIATLIALPTPRRFEMVTRMKHTKQLYLRSALRDASLKIASLWLIGSLKTASSARARCRSGASNWTRSIRMC